jgi:CTP synthase
MKLAGMNPERDLVEIVEIAEHPWFVGVQFHPELKSTVSNPHPLFVDFVKASLKSAKSTGSYKPLKAKKLAADQS